VPRGIDDCKHGDADRILRSANAGKRLPALIEQATLLVTDGGPHAIAWTHAERATAALLGSLSGEKALST
jgi:non-heme chloroperoxidase